jgi:hypothetical protein
MQTQTMTATVTIVMATSHAGRMLLGGALSFQRIFFKVSPKVISVALVERDLGGECL